MISLSKVAAGVALALAAGAAHSVAVTSMTIEEVGTAWGGGTSAGTATGGGHFYFTQAVSVPNGDDAGAAGASFTSDLGPITNGTGQASASAEPSPSPTGTGDCPARLRSVA